MSAHLSAVIKRLVRLLLTSVAVLGCVAGPQPAATFAPIEGATILVRGERAAPPSVGDDEIKSLARADAAFGLDVYRALAAANTDNLIVGPHSISTALAMIYAGARGETATEMADVLHFAELSGDISPTLDAIDRALASRSEPGVVDLRTANQAFAQPGLPLVDQYLETLTRDFGAPLAELPFADPEAARQVINKWAAQRTNDRIPALFPAGALTPGTVLVLVNAVSFEASWHYLFDPAATTYQRFTLGDGSAENVLVMHFDLYLPLSIGDDYRAVELPYGVKGDMSMVLILPDDLSAFDATVDAQRLQSIFDAITEQGIHLSLPKFSFSSHPDMDTTLKGLGMRRVYGDADLSGMIDGSGYFLQTVQHEAFIEVDETGTEAHAATGAGIAVSHGPTITFDRPFFFVIRDRTTGAILFLGRVTDPGAT